MSDTRTPRRNPKAIASEARSHLDNASKAFVPVNVVKSAELAVEFMEATAAVLEDAGLLPDDAAPSSTDPQS